MLVLVPPNLLDKGELLLAYKGKFCLEFIEPLVVIIL